MKILCVIDSLVSGGAQRQMVQLAIGFKDRGYEVRFLTYHKLNFFKPELDYWSIHLHTIVEPNYIKRLFKMRKAIRKENPDVVLAFLQSPSFIATFAGFPYRRWRLVVGERSADPKAPYSFISRFFKFFHFFPDYIVGNSNKSLEILRKTNPLLNKSKQKVIYNIVSISEQLSHVENNKNKYLEVVVAARYVKLKNLDGLIEAISLLPDIYKNRIRVNWYGMISIDNVNYIQSVQDKINKYELSEKIILNDTTSDIFKKYLQADFVAMLSYHESFPNSICEAMLLKKPVIVSRVSDIGSLIKEDLNGFVCEPDDPNSIKHALIKAIDSTSFKNKKMGENNYNLAVKMFSKDKIIDSYLKLFKGER